MANKTARGGRKLTARQSRFVDEYLADLNATQAATRSGYSAKTAEFQGSRLLSNVKVAAAVQERMNQRAERTHIDADYVLSGIAKNIRRCEQGEPVRDRSGELVMIETDDGSVAPAYKYDAGNALKGYEMLGKHLRLFTDRIDHTTGGEKIKTFAGMYAVQAKNDDGEP